MSKNNLKERQQKLQELVHSFCHEKLDQDYAQLCEKLISKMGRKRDVPFKHGQLNIWAAAVVHAIGSINFLFDKSFEPYASVSDINNFFGTSGSTVSQKSKKIKDMFRMGYYDSEFSTGMMNQSNPLNNMVMVDGFIVPLDSIPEEYQQMVKEARAQGRDIEFRMDR